MKYLLDTDILVYFLNGREEVGKKISEIDPKDLATCIITHTELHYGVNASSKKKSNLNKVNRLFDALIILPYDEEASLIFAKEKAKLKRSGKLIADMDLMIASIALRHKLKLVTNNKKHFSHISNLEIETWLSARQAFLDPASSPG